MLATLLMDHQAMDQPLLETLQHCTGHLPIVMDAAQVLRIRVPVEVAAAHNASAICAMQKARSARI